MRDLPLILHRHGIYYGWIALFAGTVGVLMSIPGQTMGVSVFTEFLIADLGISRLDLSFTYLAGTLGSAFLLPKAGRLLDYFGARVLAAIASLSLAAFLVFLAYSPSISRSLQDLTGISPYGAALLVSFLAFLGIRHFGQGQLTMASRTMMSLWFDKRRGLMLGISGVFVALGFGIAPAILSDLIDRYSWQEVLQILAIASVVMACFAILLFRRSPEHCGLVIDGGETLDSESSAEEVLAKEESFTAEEAKRTRTFWIFVAGMVCHSMLITAATFNMAHIGSLHGLSHVEAFRVFVPISICSVLAEIVCGYLSDRISLKYLLALEQAGIVVGLVGLDFYSTPLGYAAVAIGFGVGGGLFALLISVAWPKLFGRRYLGAIMGIVTASMVAGSAFGPFLFSFGESVLNDFGMVLYVCALIPLVITFAAFFADPPRHPARNFE